MDLVELGARSMDLVDLEFLELGCLAGKNGVELFLWIWSCVELSQTRPGNIEECTPISDPRSVVSSSPPPKYPKRLLLPVLSHSRQEPLFPSQHMHREAQRIYTRISICSRRTIKDRIFKVGSARFINMHIK
jgi:hypothetical protein